MLRIAFVLLLVLSFSNAQDVDLESRSTANPYEVLTVDGIVVGVDTLKSNWFRVGEWNTFSGYFRIVPARDSSATEYHAKGVDSVDIKIRYSLDYHRDERNAEEYWKVGQSGPVTVATLTATDTLNQGRHWFSFHNPSSIAPGLARNMLIWVESGASTDSLRFRDFYILRQP